MLIMNGYEYVLEQIKSLKESDGDTLYIGNCGLTELPVELKEVASRVKNLDLGSSFFLVEENTVYQSVGIGIKNEIQDFSLLNCFSNLEWLNLSSNSAVNGLFLNSLNNLTYLDISHCSLSPEFKLPDSLINLTYLNLSYSNLSDFSFLPKATLLKHLNLGYAGFDQSILLKNLQDIEYLDISDRGDTSLKLDDLLNLTKLKKLILGSTILDDQSAIASWSVLEELKIGFSGFLNLDFLKNCFSLKSLEVKGHKLIDISSVSGLKNLEKIDIFSNAAMKEISSFRSLPNLKELELSCEVTNLDFIRDNLSLEKLEIKSFDLENIEGLSSHLKLEELEIKSYRLKSLTGINAKSALKKLRLKSCPISDFSFMATLSGLEELELLSVLISDISLIVNLINLRKFSFTREIDIPHASWLREIVKAEGKIENISNLKIRERYSYYKMIDEKRGQFKDITILSKLQKLEELDVSDNKIEYLPSEIVRLPLLKVLKLENNPIKNIPTELVSSYSVDKLRNFFDDLDTSGSTNNDEFKVIVIGNGRVGKTALVKRLIENIFDPNEKSTHGIQLSSYKMDEKKLSFWDFGGQDIYHTTHKIFMATRAVFVIVWDKESETSPYYEEVFDSGQKDRYDNLPLNYWLDYTKHFGKASPVIIVQSKFERDGTIEPKFEDKKYNVIGKCSLESSLENDEENGFDTFKFLLNKAINKLPNARLMIPKSWYNVRKQLNEFLLDRNDIPYDEYIKVCNEHNVLNSESISDARTESPEKTLLSFLVDSGNVFYYEGLFDNRIILNQEWVIDAVYALLNRNSKFYQEIIERNGRFFWRHLELAWSDHSDKEKELFLSFMLANEACYEITATKIERQFLIPVLLRDDKPDIISEAWSDEEYTSLKLKHDFLHYGIMQSFIVRMGGYNLTAPERLWKYGVAIKDEKASALIEVFPHLKEIIIKIKGEKQFDLLEKIVKEFEEINKDSDRIKKEISTNGTVFINWEDFLNDSYPKNLAARINEAKLQGFKCLAKRNDELKKFESKMSKQPVSIFLSYSHEYMEYFEVFRNKLQINLDGLRDYAVEIFEDTKISAGEKWDEAIQNKIMNCDCAILLVSDAFLASKYIMNNEIEPLKKLMEKTKKPLLPVYFYPCDFYQSETLNQIQFFKRHGKDYGSPDKSDKFCFADLVKFRDDGTLIPNPEISRYIQDFVKELINVFSKMSRLG